MQKYSEKKFASIGLMQDEKSDSDQQFLGKIIGSGADKWDKSFSNFSPQFLFDTVESCWVLVLA